MLAAARALKYRKLPPEGRRGLLRIEVILVRPETSFFSRLSQAFARIAETLDPAIALHRTFMEERDCAAIAARIADNGLRRAALIVAIPDHPAIRASLAAVDAKGQPIVEIVTRAQGLDLTYVGIDNYAAGRMAGLMMSRMQPRSGVVVAMCHSGLYQVHRDRIRGFSDYLSVSSRPDLAFTQALFGGDDGALSAELMREALDAAPDLVGFYNAGGGNGSLAEVLRAHPRGRGVFFVGHELTERSAAALREGVMQVVFDQAPETQAQRAVELTLAALGLKEGPVANPPIRFATITAENI